MTEIVNNRKVRLVFAEGGEKTFDLTNPESLHNYTLGLHYSHCDYYFDVGVGVVMKKVRVIEFLE